jgi:hypothetical protein
MAPAEEIPCCKSGLYLIERFPYLAMLGTGRNHMLLKSYDIFKRDAGGEVWVEAVRDLESAKSRLIELAAEAPGQYVIFSQRSGRMVSSGTVVASPAARASARETEKEKPSEHCAASGAGKSDTLW